MVRTHTLSGAAATLAVLVLVSGCGGTNPEPASTPASPGPPPRWAARPPAIPTTWPSPRPT